MALCGMGLVILLPVAELVEVLRYAELLELILVGVAATVWQLPAEVGIKGLWATSLGIRGAGVATAGFCIRPEGVAGFNGDILALV